MSPKSDSEAGRRPRLDSRLRKAMVRASLFKRAPKVVQIGRFALLERLGAGRMGEVYAAYDHRLDRKVAIKLVRGSGQTNPVADRRLLREAQTLAQLSHPNVVQVYDAGVFEGRVFIAMEFVRGTTMTRWLESLQDLPRRRRNHRILDQFIACGRGLQAAHDAGLTHRDFKPDNILVGDDGRTRVADFGLARARSTSSTSSSSTGVKEPRPNGTPPALRPVDALAATEEEEREESASSNSFDATLTPRGAVVGTPAYMAAEVLRGQVASHRSDQFSFCVALFEALHGERPFHGASIRELEADIRSRTLTASSYHASLPTAVRKALTRGLSADADDRFPGMCTLLRELEEGPRRRRRLLIGLAAVVALGLLALFLYQRGPEDSPERACALDGQRRMAALWHPARAESLRHAIQAERGTYAREAWERRILPTLDGYATSWQDHYSDVCLERHYRTRSASWVDRRMDCLEERHAHLAATLEHAGDAATAVLLVDRLPAIDDCGRPAMLESRGPPPENTAARQRLQELSRALQGATVSLRAGRFARARDEAGRIARAAEDGGYSDIVARALLLEGWSTSRLADKEAQETAFALLERATGIALERRVNAVAVEAFARLVYARVDAGRDLQTILLQARLMEPVARGLTAGRSVYLLLLNNLGTLHLARDDRDIARGYFNLAIAGLEAWPDVDNQVELSNARLNLALLTPEPRERQRLMDSVLELHDQRLGAAHPESLQRRMLASYYLLSPQRARDMVAPACRDYRQYHARAHAADLVACQYQLAQLSADLGERSRAVAELDQAPLVDTEHRPRALLEGYRHLFAGDPARAKQSFVQVAPPTEPAHQRWRRLPFASAQLGLGLSAQALGDHAAAVEPLEQAYAEFLALMRMNANNTEYQRSLARAGVALARALWPDPDSVGAGEGAGELRRERALALANEAQAWYRQATPGHERQLQEIALWLRERGPL